MSLVRRADSGTLVVAAARSARSAIPAPPAAAAVWTLLYDGQCAFCRRWVARLKRWDRGALVRCVPWQEEAAWRDRPDLSRGALAAAAHLVAPDGRVYAGAAAARPLLGLLPGGRWLAGPLALPLMPRAAAMVYAWVARHRHQLGCGSPACRRDD